MKQPLQTLFDAVEAQKQSVLDAERQIWNNPEEGYREWKTSAYLKEKFEALGYRLHMAGNIPGFYTDIETGRPGPKVAIFGEMDSLVIDTHPDCDPKTKAVHACGHNCQCAALLGIAIAFAAPHALDGLCGSIRLIAVPAEEIINVEFREELQRQGIIRYISGKIEFLYRGYLDGVDMAMMMHTSTNPKSDVFGCNAGSDGCITKVCEFTGKAAHAGALPHKGANALYAATNAIGVANALRETFQDEDHVRFHPIITKGGTAVNIIPDSVTVESYVRAATMKSMKDANEKINRAFAGCAAAMGCGIRFRDRHGMSPRRNDPNMMELYHEVGGYFFDEEQMHFNRPWGTGCSDMGDISTVMPAVHPLISGASGVPHSVDYHVTDAETACVTSAKIQAGVAALLLTDGAEAAKKVLRDKQVVYSSVKEYFADIDKTSFSGEGVTTEEDGRVVLHYKA